jgi:hypothetical protein
MIRSAVSGSRTLSYSLVVFASLANAAPSATALNPAHAICDLNESDISGSGVEIQRKSSRAAHPNDQGSYKSARDWNELAARCRNLARWQDEEGRAVLLRLAEEYEARAKTAVEPRKS